MKRDGREGSMLTEEEGSEVEEEVEIGGGDGVNRYLSGLNINEEKLLKEEEEEEEEEEEVDDDDDDDVDDVDVDDGIAVIDSGKWEGGL